MRNLLLTAILGASLGVSALANPTGRANAISGDYVEARTAAVYAGACHFNGELVVAGRDAEMVWNIKEGAWNGVDLKGVAAMAVVSADANLREKDVEHRSVLYVDKSASDAQTKAVVSALKSKYETMLGKVLAVKRIDIDFAHKGNSFQVNAKNVTKMVIKAMPNGECCKMPHMVLYEPLVELKNRKVGFTEASGVKDSTLKVDWTKENDNTAFYGTFAL